MAVTELTRSRLDFAFASAGVAVAVASIVAYCVPATLVQVAGWRLYSSVAGAALLVGVCFVIRVRPLGRRRRVFVIAAAVGMVAIETLVNENLGTTALLLTAICGSAAFVAMGGFELALAAVLTSAFMAGHIAVPLILFLTQDQWWLSMQDPRVRQAEAIARVVGALLATLSVVGYCREGGHKS